MLLVQDLCLDHSFVSALNDLCDTAVADPAAAEERAGLPHLGRELWAQIPGPGTYTAIAGGSAQPSFPDADQQDRLQPVLVHILLFVLAVAGATVVLLQE